MLQYHQLATNFVCLLFGTEQVVCLSELFGWKQLPSANGNTPDESKETEPKLYSCAL